MNHERTYKVGRRAELVELQQSRRVEVDTMVQALRNLFEPHDVELAYTERIDIQRMKVYMKEIERKHAELGRIVKELAILRVELDGE
jgi:hypothetical protein